MIHTLVCVQTIVETLHKHSLAHLTLGLKLSGAVVWNA